MAQVIRSANSSNDWTRTTYLPRQPPQLFESGADPSLDHLDPSIPTSPTAEDPNLSDAAENYLSYLHLATYGTQESAIDDLAAATLKLVGFNE